MAKLEFKTKNNTSPQGKQKVYFCCHPADFEQCFDEITDMIIQKADCAIWYDTEPESENIEEIKAILDEMQLLVVPITVDFLEKSNHAREVEFQYALDNHIPILPILQKGSLGPKFNAACGNIQYLDPYDTDITAIGFQEKLDAFLNNVLVGDELAEKIRAAFDAYVFLSYRKKDRVYAQKLMRLIHENEFCRDIAIWYDEFLVPGENFNDAISKALEKSELFAMAVTPNLVNEDNYVMEIEYPMAKNAGKQIIPAELLTTDFAALKNKYPDIPECVNAYDKEALAHSFQKAVKKLAIRENDNSPIHNYLIGLAYLKGIDVEIDFDRAIALIQSSAENGLPEALEKLVYMYRFGEGVEVNFEKASQWADKLIQLHRSRYDNEKTLYSGNKLCDALGLQMLLCTEAGRLEDVLKCCLEKTKLEESLLCNGERDAEIYASLMSDYSRLVAFYKDTDLQITKQYSEKILEMAKNCDSELQTSKTDRIKCFVHQTLGEIYRQTADAENAKRNFECAIDLATKLAESKEDSQRVSAIRMLTISYGSLSRLAKEIGNEEEQKRWLEEYFNSSSALRNETNALLDYVYFCDACLMKGDFFKKKGETENAVFHYTIVQDIASIGIQYYPVAILYEQFYKAGVSDAKINLEKNQIQKMIFDYENCKNKLIEGIETYGLVSLKEKLAQVNGYLEISRQITVNKEQMPEASKKKKKRNKQKDDKENQPKGNLMWIGLFLLGVILSTIFIFC